MKIECKKIHEMRDQNMSLIFSNDDIYKTKQEDAFGVLLAELLRRAYVVGPMAPLHTPSSLMDYFAAIHLVLGVLL